MKAASAFCRRTRHAVPLQPVAAIATGNVTSYSVDPATGLVTFETAPGSGLIITADFTYYFRCRFTEDKYDFENFMLQLWQLKKLTFISARS